MQTAVGLLGGTFNPIHCGHLRSAIEVREHCGLARVIMIPAFVPPHKETEDIAPAAARLAMTEMAVADIAGVTCSDVEIRRRGTSYTIDTWEHFRRELGDGVKPYLIVGQEVFLQIHTWHRAEELLCKAAFIITNRPVANPAEDTGALAGYLQSTLKGLMPEIINVEVPVLSISSSEIRHKIAAGRGIDCLTPPAVQNYIFEESLYT